MSDTRISSYEKIGYKTSIPKGSDIDNFEKIVITDKLGKKTTLYRKKTEQKEFDETTDFNKSWDVFNSHLN